MREREVRRGSWRERAREKVEKERVRTNDRGHALLYWLLRVCEMSEP